MQDLNIPEISVLIQKRLENFEAGPEFYTEGTIVSLKDGIVQLSGLSTTVLGELIELGQNTYGLALNLEEDMIGAVVLGSSEGLSEGQIVKGTKRVLKVPVGKALLGRVVNALGVPLDERGAIQASSYLPVERPAPSVIDRQSVTQALQTGIKAIDVMVPIGRGQRELIIGDRQTGKTAIAIDTIINQRDTGVRCIYVAIGQKMATIAHIVRQLTEHDALKYTTVVVAGAAEAAVLQFLAPYAGCAMGEYFRDLGEDALIVYDDLSKQAWAWREISLLLRRPPGREAYPGDIFYLHSRLLERAARVRPAYVAQKTQGRVQDKTGSLTALPIIETQAGDVSAFVPTNVISITDGQIFLETDLFNAGVRPAINPGLSVSRVGGAAQTPLIKKLGGGVRLSLAQSRELAAFSQLMSDLDPTARGQLERGLRVTELLKQQQYQPLSVAEMAVLLFAVDRGYLDDIALHRIKAFEYCLLSDFGVKHAHLWQKIQGHPLLSNELEHHLHQLILSTKAEFNDTAKA